MKGVRQRKTHSKSRNGCDQCKRRHHKCNEVRPICSNCERLKTPCSLATTPSPSVLSPASQVAGAMSHNLLGYERGQTTQSSNLLDLELMHHGITCTAKAFGNEEEDPAKSVLQFSYHYLLHASLALSALHLFSKQPSRTELFVQASSHQDTALSLVRPHIADLTEEHSVPVLMFSGVVSISLWLSQFSILTTCPVIRSTT